MLAGQSGPLAQDGAALGRQQGAPADERFISCIYGTVDPLLVTVGDLCDYFVGRGVGNGQTSFAIYPLPIYVGTGFE
ncbi:hypothetical protein D9M71_630040 [compost metagenome]